MADADIVILSQREEVDPRNEKRRATVRVVLHRCVKRVLVDIARGGTDATGAASPVRIDPHAPNVPLDDICGAYCFLEQAVSYWYERAIAAECRAAEAEAQARRAESRSQARYIGPSLPLPVVDPKAAARTRVEQLLALAAESHSENEARNAAISAAKLIREHALSVK